jgi:hypothetical protein
VVRVCVAPHVEPAGARLVDELERLVDAAPVLAPGRLDVRDLDADPAVLADADRLGDGDSSAAPSPRMCEK